MLKVFTRSLIVVGAMALLAAPSMAQAKDVYKVDNSHSQVLFQISHLNAGQFFGQFLKFSGQLVLDGRSKSSVAFKVRTNSVFTNSTKRDNHLRGPDFFNAKQFPLMTFKSDKVYKLAFGRYRVSGTLTAKGVSKKVKFFCKITKPVKDPWGNTRIGAYAELTIKRSEFGISYMPKGLGDKVKLMISLEAIKAKK